MSPNERKALVLGALGGLWSAIFRYFNGASCVHSGATGYYLDSEQPDAIEGYVVSKRPGEVDYSNAITLRRSIIGRELSRGGCRVAWFLS